MQMHLQLSPSLKTTLAPALQTSMKVLAMDAAELEQFLTAQFMENPMLDMETLAVDSAIQFDVVPSISRTGFLHNATGAVEIPRATTLEEHLYAQVNIAALSAQEIRAVKILLSSLDDDGYLRVSPAELACSFGMPEVLFAAAWREVRALDPAGVGACSLQDCLCLQLTRRGYTDEVLFRVVRYQLDAVAKGQYRVIAKENGISLQQATACCKLIGTLCPRPVSFAGNTHYITPDLVVERMLDGLRVFVNSYVSPRLRINESYLRLTRVDLETKVYIREKTAQAKNVLSAVRMRESTLLRIAQELVRCQRGFFLEDAPLQPFTQKMLAQALDLHPSTISRAIQNKTLRCAAGIFPLSYFFGSELADHVSANKAIATIRQLLAETPTLSDRLLAARLQEQGIPISRRTVAKYRATEGIANKSVRMRQI